MSEHTPTTEDVRDSYTDINCAAPDGTHEHGCPQGTEFDRWLAEHDAKVLEDAADEWDRTEKNVFPGDWLDERAASLRVQAAGHEGDGA